MLAPGGRWEVPEQARQRVLVTVAVPGGLAALQASMLATAELQVSMLATAELQVLMQ
jgi:hypothetical protein